MTPAERQAHTVALLREARDLEAQIRRATTLPPLRNRRRIAPADEWRRLRDAAQGEAREVALHVEALRWEVVILYGPLAGVVAKRWVRPALDIQDLIQQGRLGLLDAAIRFDPDRGVQFRTFAKWWVLARISAKYGPYQHIKARFREIQRNIGRAEGAGYSSDPKVLAEVLDVSAETIRWVQTAALPAVGLDSPAGEDGRQLHEILPAPEPDDVPERWDVERLCGLIAGLPVRERKIVCGCFGIGRELATLEVVGREVCVKRERARQLREVALGKLRKKMGVAP